ncbi:MAG: hypothetical protein M1816_004906 [Peltula sp. TS41687]|nr:MAG: hypothetical protein M1816_004906 [Peltula sp. TS41687]
METPTQRAKDVNLDKKRKEEWQMQGMSQIAEKAGIDQDRTARVLRLLATHRIFQPVAGESETFQHTAASALLARDGGFHATADMQVFSPTEWTICLKAASETSTLIKNSPYASDAKNSPFFTTYGMSIYEYYERLPQKGKRFAQAMSSYAQLDRQLSDLRDAFPWVSLKNGKVVDIGGGSGHISVALAQVRASSISTAASRSSNTTSLSPSPFTTTTWSYTRALVDTKGRGYGARGFPQVVRGDGKDKTGAAYSNAATRTSRFLPWPAAGANYPRLSVGSRFQEVANEDGLDGLDSVEELHVQSEAFKDLSLPITRPPSGKGIICGI